ncbi:MAG TPA: hypothetical protein PLQ76_05780, partial [bacterium]|nr:hypothetical protein [bacterium]
MIKKARYIEIIEMKMRRALVPCLIIIASLSAESTCAQPNVKVVDRPSVKMTNKHYIGNRKPLEPSVFIKLPVGAVKP